MARTLKLSNNYRKINDFWPPEALSGVLLGPSWTFLGASWALLGPSWAVLGPSWAALRPSWAVLKPSWSPRRPKRPNLLICHRFLYVFGPQKGPSTLGRRMWRSAGGGVGGRHNNVTQHNMWQLCNHWIRWIRCIIASADLPPATRHFRTWIPLASRGARQEHVQSSRCGAF